MIDRISLPSHQIQTTIFLQKLPEHCKIIRKYREMALPDYLFCFNKQINFSTQAKQTRFCDSKLHKIDNRLYKHIQYFLCSVTSRLQEIPAVQFLQCGFCPDALKSLFLCIMNFHCLCCLPSFQILCSGGSCPSHRAWFGQQSVRGGALGVGSVQNHCRPEDALCKDTQPKYKFTFESRKHIYARMRLNYSLDNTFIRPSASAVIL